MTDTPSQVAALSGSINVDPESMEEEFRLRRDEVCAEYAAHEGTRGAGQLTGAEYAVAIVVLVAAFVGILLCR